MEWINSTPGGLEGYDCKECLNRGYFAVLKENGVRVNRPCRCMTIRAAQRRLRESGLEDQMKRYSFAGWQTPERWQQVALDRARSYIEDPKGWLVLSGRPGAGKSHLCTAVTVELIRRGWDARYMLWKEEATRAKAVVNDEETYLAIVEPLKRVEVLYIDDFLKGVPSNGDKNLAFELINARYLDERKLTILSTEKTVEDLMEIDEAVGSRIYERSRGFYLDLSRAENWRLR